MPIEAKAREMAVNAASRLFFGPLPPENGAYRRAVAWDEVGSTIARESLAAGNPILIGRFGSTELAVASFYVRWRLDRKVRPPYPATLRRIIQVNAGVFPVDDQALDGFCDVFLDAVSQTDVMGVWFNRNEHRIVERFCPDARLVHLEALNAVLRENPWSSQLAGKTVLVIHPFARSIESQYRTHRAQLFENPNVLPEFELKTLPAVQSIAGNDCGYPTWFDALEHMKQQVSEVEFDVAIIGAGAYGLPLGASVKALGGQAVHLGGATQLLFGIRGRRWEIESPDDIAPLFNEYWVRPSAEETPSDSELVEGGCYW